VSNRLPMPGVKELSTEEWQSAHVITSSNISSVIALAKSENDGKRRGRVDVPP
jgi:hypothetical protein